MRVLVLDFFGVLVGEILPIWFKKMFGPKDVNSIKEKYSKKADLGEITYEELLNKVSEDYNIDKNKLDQEWMSSACLNKELVYYLEKSSIPIVLLSNAPSGLVERIIDNYKIDYLFDYKIISYKIGVAKPKRSIYEKIYDFYDKTNEFIFVDDNKNNLLVPLELGWKVIHFTGNECIKELKKYI